MHFALPNLKTRLRAWAQGVGKAGTEVGNAWTTVKCAPITEYAKRPVWIYKRSTGEATNRPVILNGGVYLNKPLKRDAGNMLEILNTTENALESAKRNICWQKLKNDFEKIIGLIEWSQKTLLHKELRVFQTPKLCRSLESAKYTLL